MLAAQQRSRPNSKRSQINGGISRLTTTLAAHNLRPNTLATANASDVHVADSNAHDNQESDVLDPDSNVHSNQESDAEADAQARKRAMNRQRGGKPKMSHKLSFAINCVNTMWWLGSYKTLWFYKRTQQQSG